MVAEKLKKEIAERRQVLHNQQQEEEKEWVHDRWVTDEGALKNEAVRKLEKHNRAVPKRLAKMGLLKIESEQGFLETEEHEVTDRVTQQDIVAGVDLQTQRKKFELKLPLLGPYTIDFTINGNYLALGGLRGHLANFNWKTFSLVGETQLKDKISDVKFLVDHSMMAVAQRRFVYMYSKEGTEMHILSKLANMDRLAFLPKHMLLVATSSTYSTMQYLDISTGKELGTKPPSVMRDPVACLDNNIATGVVTTCDIRGVCKFWSPSVVDPLVQLKAHKGPIRDVRFHQNGRFFVTLGGDHKMKIWDCRTMRALEEYAVTYTFDTIDISANGLVAMGGGTNIQIWKDLFSTAKPNSPYLKHGLGYGKIAHKVRFAPFEDVLGVGHSEGFSSVIIPGAGEANPDFYYSNPYESEAHRKERVVTSLLDKLPPETISMDLQLGGVNEDRLADYTKNLMAHRKARAIREKKQRKVDRSAGEQAPTGLAVGHDDEIDEEIGFRAKGATKVLKTKKEVQKERKMRKWDQKDSSDKVRSKQIMRHSRIVQKKRHEQKLGLGKEKEKEEGEGALVGAKRKEGEMEEEPLPHKKQRHEEEKRNKKKKKNKEEVVNPEFMTNAAFRRFRSTGTDDE